MPSTRRCSCYSDRKVQPVLVICGFHICEFRSLKLICQPQINTPSTVLVIRVDTCRAAQRVPSRAIPAEVVQSDTLPSREEGRLEMGVDQQALARAGWAVLKPHSGMSKPYGLGQVT